MVKVYVPAGVPEIPPLDPEPVLPLPHPVVDSRTVSSTALASDTRSRRRLGKTKNSSPASAIPPPVIPIKEDGGSFVFAVVGPVVEMVRVTC
jgi:hypothetical protein